MLFHFIQHRNIYIRWLRRYSYAQTHTDTHTYTYTYTCTYISWSLSHADNLTICSYYSSLLMGLLDCIQCLYICLLAISLRKCHKWISSYFSNSAQHFLYVLFEWFVGWKVSGCTPTDLCAIASGICAR